MCFFWILMVIDGSICVLRSNWHHYRYGSSKTSINTVCCRPNNESLKRLYSLNTVCYGYHIESSSNIALMILIILSFVAWMPIKCMHFIRRKLLVSIAINHQLLHILLVNCFSSCCREGSLVSIVSCWGTYGFNYFKIIYKLVIWQY